MTLALVYSRAQVGIVAPLVTVEVHLSNGLPGLSMVGLAQTAVKESKERVRSAIMNSGFEFPARKIIINLAPADLPKSSGRFDLAIALGILAAGGQIPNDLSEYEFAAELALTGELRPTSGVLAIAIATKKAGRKLIVAKACADEARLIAGLTVFSAQHFLEVVSHLSQRTILSSSLSIQIDQAMTYPDLQDVCGQAYAKRALEIAAAGAHNVLLSGPPGTGKTMLAMRLLGLLPTMSEEEAEQSAAIYSVSHTAFPLSHWKRRSFRAPHHTASAVALVGGGNPPRPGEISLAHQGVLFLDELPEFQRQVLESLREPLESGCITISRAVHQVEFPARFQLIAAMNPCPCGYLTDPDKVCRCTPEQIQRYHAKISGPFLDRIDMHIEVPRVPLALLSEAKPEEPSATVRARVLLARERQMNRANRANAYLEGDDLKRDCRLTQEDRLFMMEAVKKLDVSARAYQRILRVARTIADLAEIDVMNQDHISEALQLVRCSGGM